MKKIIITGFEPFGNDAINPSQEIVNRLDNNINNCVIIKIILPVVFNKAADILIKLIDYEKPDLVLMLGYAKGRNNISLEKRAININDARIKDNEGNHPIVKQIAKEEYIYTNLDVEEIVNHFSNKYKIDISLDAGKFVCNDLFYRVGNYLKNEEILFDFIHIPDGDIEELMTQIVDVIGYLGELYD